MGILQTSWGSTNEAFENSESRICRWVTKEAFLSRDGAQVCLLRVTTVTSTVGSHRKPRARPLLAGLSGELGRLIRKIRGQEVSEHTGSMRWEVTVPVPRPGASSGRITRHLSQGTIGSWSSSEPLEPLPTPTPSVNGSSVSIFKGLCKPLFFFSSGASWGDVMSPLYFSFLDE